MTDMLKSWPCLETGTLQMGWSSGRSSRWAPLQWGVPGRGRLEPDPQGGEGVLWGRMVNQHRRKEAETEVVWPGAPEAGRGQEGSSPRAPGGSTALPTPSLQTSCAQNREKWIVSLPDCGTGSWQPQETNTGRVYSRYTESVYFSLCERTKWNSKNSASNRRRGSPQTWW